MLEIEITAQKEDVWHGILRETHGKVRFRLIPDLHEKMSQLYKRGIVTEIVAPDINWFLELENE